MTAQHTKTPWRQHNGYSTAVHANVQGHDITVAKMIFGNGDEERANAALIVKAVNAHGALVEAVEFAYKELSQHPDRYLPNNPVGYAYRKLKDALKLAEAE